MNGQKNFLCLVSIIIFGIFSLNLVSMPVEAVQDIILDHTVIDNDIYSNESAKFSILLENKQDSIEQVQISVSGIAWTLSADSFVYDLSPRESVEFDIELFPPKSVTLGSYALKLLATTADGEVTEEIILVNVNKIIEEPVLSLDLDIPEEVSPGEKFNVVIDVTNNGRDAVPNVEAYVKSELFDEVGIERLGTLELGTTENAFNIEVDIPKDKEPRDYDVEIGVAQGYDILIKTTEQIKVLPASDIAISENIEKGFLKRSYVVTLVNQGNTIVKDEYIVNLKSFENNFFKGEPAPDRKELIDGKREVAWMYNLAPNEILTIRYSISYWPLLLIILLLVGSFSAVFFYINTSISIDKRILFAEEKGLKFVKIQLHIKNKSGSRLKNVNLVDTIPSPLKLLKEFGTIVPDDVHKEESKTKLRWKFEALESNEERVISYGIRSGLSIIGKINLPEAKMRFQKSGVWKATKSNKLTLQGKTDVNVEEE